MRTDLIRQIRRIVRPIACGAAIAGAASCGDITDVARPPTLAAPQPLRIGSLGPTCYVNDTSHVTSGYVGYYDPVTFTVCGVPVSLIAGSAGDHFPVYWYGPANWVQPISMDSAWIMTGGDGLGGTYASATGEVPLTIDFGSDITNVSVLWNMTPIPGSRVDVFDANGLVLDSAFYGSNTSPSLPVASIGVPGYPVGSTFEIHSFTARGIRRVRATAAAGASLNTGSKMWLQTWFEPDSTCPPAGDSLLDSPSVRDSLVTILGRSNPNATPGSGSKLERGGIIWRDSSGALIAAEITDPSFVRATECEWTFLGGSVPPPIPGATGIAVFHTHPHSNNEQVYGCASGPGQPRLAQTIGDGRIVPTARPDDFGGGSDGDWRAADSSGVPQYVINKDGRVYRLDPGIPVSNRRNNPNRWEWKTPANAGCFTHL